jgi:capsular exopolysaccharide synthesis family protein
MCLGSVAALGAAMAAWFLLSPHYTAFAQVQVASVPPWITKAWADSPQGKAEFETYKRLQAAALKNRFVLNAVLKKPEIKRLRIVQEQPEPLTYFEEELKVQNKEGEILTLSLTGTEADELVDFVRAVVHTYLVDVVKKEQDERKVRLQGLKQVYAVRQDKLAKMHEALRDRQGKGGNADGMRDKQVSLQTALNEATRLQSQVELDLSQARSQLKAYKNNRKDLLAEITVPEFELEAALESDEEARKYQKTIKYHEDYLEEWGSWYTNPNHYLLVQARKEKAKYQGLLKKRQARLKRRLLVRLKEKASREHQATVKQLESAIPLLEERHKKLRADVSRLTTEVGNISVALPAPELVRLREDINQETVFVNNLTQQLNVLEVEVQAGSRVTLYQEAGLQKVDTKRRVMAAALSPIVALIGVCLAVGWFECRARKIQSADEVTTGLGMRVVGAVPAVPGPALGRLVTTSDAQDEYESSLLESIDAIRTMLLRDASVEATRVLMVTSAVAGEGKTTLATNLATSLARAGRKTLLVDCDLRCPAAHQLFEQTLQPGVSEILLGEVDLVDAIRPTTAIEGLWLIPAGQWDREVIQALARDGAQEMFDRLREEFDFIVVDSHPVLPATDSLLIGQNVDAVILALMKDVSQVPRVHTAGQRLTSLGIRVLGAVVNGMPTDIYENGNEYAGLNTR